MKARAVTVEARRGEEGERAAGVCCLDTAAGVSLGSILERELRACEQDARHGFNRRRTMWAALGVFFQERERARRTTQGYLHR